MFLLLPSAAVKLSAQPTAALPGNLFLDCPMAPVALGIGRSHWRRIQWMAIRFITTGMIVYIAAPTKAHLLAWYTNLLLVKIGGIL